MVSGSEIFCIGVLLFFGSAFSQIQVFVTSSVNDTLNGSCSCGGFSTSEPTVDCEPLLSQTPGLNVKCDEEGATTCKGLCLALATAAKAKGPEILCVRLKDANELKLSAFYKICDRSWTYADMTADEPLCCENSKVKECSSVSVDIPQPDTPTEEAI